VLVEVLPAIIPDHDLDLHLRDVIMTDITKDVMIDATIDVMTDAITDATIAVAAEMIVVNPTVFWCDI